MALHPPRVWVKMRYPSFAYTAEPKQRSVLRKSLGGSNCNLNDLDRESGENFVLRDHAYRYLYRSGDSSTRGGDRDAVGNFVGVGCGGYYEEACSRPS